MWTWLGRTPSTLQLAISSFSRTLPMLSWLPLDRDMTCTSVDGDDDVSASTVGPKNIHSSSGWATSSRTFAAA